MNWKTPPKLEGKIDILAIIQRANGQRPAPTPKPDPKEQNPMTNTYPKGAKMLEIDLIPGDESEKEAAFCPEKMKAAGVDAVALSTALTERLGPFAALLADGRGIGVVVRGDDASVVGILADD